MSAMSSKCAVINSWFSIKGLVHSILSSVENKLRFLRNIFQEVFEEIT